MICSDTDSIMIAMTTDKIEELVNPGMEHDWDRLIKPKWFADETPEGQKTPGFLKEEFTSKTGRYIGLRLRLKLIII